MLHPSGFLLCDPPALLNNRPILSPVFSFVIFIKTYTCFPLLFQAKSETKTLLFVPLTLYLIMFYLQHIFRLLTSFLSSPIYFSFEKWGFFMPRAREAIYFDPLVSLWHWNCFHMYFFRLAFSISHPLRFEMQVTFPRFFSWR